MSDIDKTLVSEADLNEALAEIVGPWWSEASASYIRAGKLSISDIKAKYVLRDLFAKQIAAALDAQAVAVKPLVWVEKAQNHTYASTQGGFTVKIDGHSGWKWQRGHIFGFADSRQGAFDAANERHAYEIGCFLKPVSTHAKLLAAAMQLPEVKALVDGATKLTAWAEELRASGDAGFWDWRDIDEGYTETVTALAPFTRKGE